MRACACVRAIVEPRRVTKGDKRKSGSLRALVESKAGATYYTAPIFNAGSRKAAPVMLSSFSLSTNLAALKKKHRYIKITKKQRRVTSTKR